VQIDFSQDLAKKITLSVAVTPFVDVSIQYHAPARRQEFFVESN